MSEKIVLKIIYICIVIMIFVCFILITSLIPVRFPVKSLDKIQDRDFYVVDYDYYMEMWFLRGDNKGFYDNEVFVYIDIVDGPDPKDIVSGDLYLCTGTEFIIYGEIVEKKMGLIEYKSYDWDVYGEVKRHYGACRPNVKYLTIYDYKWFDKVLEPIGLYTSHPDY